MSKTTPAASASPVKSTRLQRGLTLYRDGAVSPAGDLYVVRGSSRHYIVNTERGTCSCPDHQRGGFQCKHLIACLVHESRIRAANTVPETPVAVA